MRGIALIGVLVSITALTVFIYACYPEEWRRSRANYVLILLHGIGLISVLTVFSCYRIIPDGLKQSIHSIGSFCYITILLMAIFTAVRLAGSFLIQKAGGNAPVRMADSANKKRWSALSLMVSGAVAAAGMVNFSRLYHTGYDLSVNKSAAVPVMKIRFCSDIHAGAGNSRKLYDDLAQALAEGDPDVILIGGDVFDETTSETDVELVRSVISSLHPRCGIYYVYGNHDNDREDWSARQMRSMDVRVLKDEMIEIDGVQIIGRLDPKNGAMYPDSLFEACRPDPAKPLIVLQHRPSQLKELGEKGVDLCLAGHTHGFNVPQFIAVGLQSDMYYGRKTFGNMTAIVSSGVSAWGFNYKFPAVNETVTVNLSLIGE